MTLVGAESPAFDKIELHLSSNEGGMASMKSIPQLELAPGKSIEFAPKGYHLMLMNQKQSLSIRDEVVVDLQFEGESRLSVNFEVASPAAM